ncbi:MAG: hypothetical protein H7176_06155 [Bdellovibrionales bacterium]|nr:hypothetical protein [Massilia sp.]
MEADWHAARHAKHGFTLRYDDVLDWLGGARPLADATAGMVASRLMGQTDVAVFNSDARFDGQMADDVLHQGAT